MSKGHSNFFHGTIGDKKDNGSLEKLNKKIISWSKEKVDELNKISHRQRNKFNTACIVYDESTGKYYNGYNHGIVIENEKKNAILFGDSRNKGLLPNYSLNQYEVGNCAEIHAINKALNDGAKLENLKLYTIHTTRNNFGKPKEACENCKYALKGKIKKNYSGWEGDDNDEH